MAGAVATEITANSAVARPGGVAHRGRSDVPPDDPTDEAARIILDGVEADRLHIDVGRDASKLIRLAPKRATHLIRNEMKDLLAA